MKEYTMEVRLTFRYAASSRGESLGRAHALVKGILRVADVYATRGIDVETEVLRPHVAEHERPRLPLPIDGGDEWPIAVPG